MADSQGNNKSPIFYKINKSGITCSISVLRAIFQSKWLIVPGMHPVHVPLQVTPVRGSVRARRTRERPFAGVRPNMTLQMPSS